MLRPPFLWLAVAALQTRLQTTEEQNGLKSFASDARCVAVCRVGENLGHHLAISNLTDFCEAMMLGKFASVIRT
jgi:hypothetical protein